MNRLNKLALLRRFFPKLYASRRIVELDDIELRQRLAHAIQHIPPDTNARLGVVFDGEHFRDLDSRAIYTMLENTFFDPINERLDRLERLMIAAGPGGATKAAEMLPQPQNAAPLPTRVPLTGLLDGPPSLKEIVLGVGHDDSGQSQIIRADMAKLVHVAVGGSSGWGKSVFLRSLAYQLARCIEPVDLVLIDLEGVTFSPFARCDRLLYPVADNETDTTAILTELSYELDRRRELYGNYPGVDSIYAYNAVAGEPIRPVVSLFDEATALLDNSAIERQIKNLSLRARKYGLWLVLAGQDWKASSLDTAIRNQLSTRIQFRAASGGQSRVLLERPDAEGIEVSGRAFGWIPGRDLVEFQAPIISHEDILAAMSGSGPQRELGENQDENDQIHEMAEAGCSKRQISLAVFGYANGETYRRIHEVLGDYTTVAEGATVGENA